MAEIQFFAQQNIRVPKAEVVRAPTLIDRGALVATITLPDGTEIEPAQLASLIKGGQVRTTAPPVEAPAPEPA